MPKTMRATAGLILLGIIAIIIAVQTVCLTEPIDLSSLRWSIKATSTTGLSSQPDADARALSFCTGITLDASSTLFIADYENSRIQKKISNALNLTTIVGKANINSTNTSTTLNLLTDVAVDSTGNISGADSATGTGKKNELGSLSGTIVAGENGAGKDITQLFCPHGIYCDLATKSLYISNFAANNIIRWVIGDHCWTLVAEV
ncbi:unnamed protein product [Adineta ricciae]|uniref:Uncharacterized protein n=1 Tax=Adineta ricciae TaxID=249248 RepID=A0A815JVS1_ADIRI|nr:unnamed protein product [Adineta ricciae]CAF1617053.1 unnamed protein product [Adineta ricciae]